MPLRTIKKQAIKKQTVKKVVRATLPSREKKKRLGGNQILEQIKAGGITEENFGPHIGKLVAKNFVAIFEKEISEWMRKLAESKRKNKKSPMKTKLKKSKK